MSTVDTHDSTASIDSELRRQQEAELRRQQEAERRRQEEAERAAFAERQRAFTETTGNQNTAAEAPPDIAALNARVDATTSPGNWSDGANYAAVQAQRSGIAEYLETEHPEYYNPQIVAESQRRGVSYNDAVDQNNETAAHAALMGVEVDFARHVYEFNGDIEDPRLATLLEENDPYSDEARFASHAAEIDALSEEINAATDPSDVAHRNELIEEREQWIDRLADGDDGLADAIQDHVSEGEYTADAVIGASADIYADTPVDELVDEYERRVAATGGDTAPRFDPIAHGIEVELNARLYKVMGNDAPPVSAFGYASDAGIETYRLAGVAVEKDITLERARFEAMDAEPRHSYSTMTYFEEMFGSDRIEHGDDRLREIAAGEHEDAIRGRLGDSGFEGAAQDQAYEDIVDAASYFNDNTDARDTLDGANDSNPEDVDYIYTEDDAQAHFMARSAGATDETTLALRQHVIDEFVASDGHVPVAFDEVERAYDGEVAVVGTLSATEQQYLLESHVNQVTRAAIAAGDNEIVFLPTIHENTGFHSAYRTELAHEAIELQLLHTDDPIRQGVATHYAVSALAHLDDDERVAFINALDGEIPVTEDQVIGESQLFARALLDSGDDAWIDVNSFGGIGFDQNPRTIAVETIRAINESNPVGTEFSQAEKEFVSVVFVNSADNNSPNAEVFAEGLARATYGSDVEAVEFHTERLTEVLERDDAWESFSITSGVDPMTRDLVTTTLVSGFEGSNGEVEYWTADDFADNDGERVIADVTVINARALTTAASDAPLTAEDEARLRAVAATEQGRDLLGFDAQTNHSLRTQVTHMILENDWTAADFGEGNGFNNRLVNGQYLVDLAARSRSEPLDQATIDNIRAIGESEAGRSLFGLDSGVSDAGRDAYVREIIANDWTVETFELTDDPSLNRTISFGFADDHLSSFREGGERHTALAAVDNPNVDGYVDNYVRAALALPTGGDAVVRDIVGEINEFRADGTSLDVIPVTLNTGDQQFDLMLFRVEQESGDTTYVDLNGKHYDDPADWREHNEMPPGTVVFSGESEGTIGEAEFVAASDNDNGNMVAVTTKEYPDTFWEKHGGKIMTGVVIVGGVLVVVGTAGAATPLVGSAAAGYAGAAGATLIGGYGAYTLYEGADTLSDHLSHGGSASFSDPVARGAYLNIADGGLTMVTAGGSGVLLKGGNMATRLASSARATTALRSFNYVDAAYQFGSNAYQAEQILSSDLPNDEKVRQLAVIGVFGAVELGLPILTNRVAGNNADFVRDANAINPALRNVDIDTALAAGATRPDQVALDPIVRTEATAVATGATPGPGPAASVAAVHIDGEVPITATGYNLLRGEGDFDANRLRNGTRPFDQSALNALRAQPDWNINAHVNVITADANGRPLTIEITNPDGYMADLQELYGAHGLTLHPDVAVAIRHHIDQDVIQVDRPGSNGSIYPGTHAEVVATNAVLNDAAAQGIDLDVDDVTLATVRNSGSDRGADFGACEHCAGILTDGPDPAHIVTD